MDAIIDMQGRRQTAPEIGTLREPVTAPRDGTVSAIDNLQIARIARLAGAPWIAAPVWISGRRSAIR
jgi:thymidine phosphorylase